MTLKQNKKIFKILFILFLIFIFFSLFLKSYSFIEGFDSSSNIKNIVFLGDSILNNQSYVSYGKSIQDYIEKKNTSYYKIYNFAQDGATIPSIYKIINGIPEYLNSTETIVLISIGGNDILSTMLNHENKNNDMYIYKLFFSYQLLLEAIKQKMNLCKIFLLDIYYPPHPHFQNWIPFLKKWNHLLEKNQENYTVIKISENMNESTDFTEFIEPSETGGEKIVNLILSLIK
jgi:hypothetical protein